MSAHILAGPNAAKLNPESYGAVAPSSQMKCQDRKLKGQTKASSAQWGQLCKCPRFRSKDFESRQATTGLATCGPL